jgi:hypothetical protein
MIVFQEFAFLKITPMGKNVTCKGHATPPAKQPKTQNTKNHSPLNNYHAH